MKNYLLLIITAVVITSCNEQKVETKVETPVYDWEDKSVFASSEFFDSYDKEADEERHVNPELAEWLLTGAISNENAEIFDHSFDPNNENNKKLTKEEISDILMKVVVMQVEDPNAPGMFFEVADTIKVESRDIVQVLTKEEWSIDKSNMSFQKNVKMMAPAIITYDEEGAERGKALLYWVKMK